MDALPIDLLDQIKHNKLYSEEKKIVVSRGDGFPELMFIGEAPGQDENKIGKPFVGRGGKLVDEWVKANDIKNYIITNIVPLIPLNEGGGIRKPTPKEIDEFQFFINYMVNTNKPKYIILLGATACEGYLKKSISSCVFKLFDNKGIKVTAIYHPAFYLRRGENGLDDFKKIYNLLINSDIKQKELTQRRLF